MGEKFWIFVKIQLIHQLNHNNVFEHLKHNNDTVISKRPKNKQGGGVQVGSKEEDFVGVLRGRGGGCFGSLVADKNLNFIKILNP